MKTLTFLRSGFFVHICQMNFQIDLLLIRFHSSGGNYGKMEPWHVIVYFGGIVLLSWFFIRLINRRGKK